MDKQILQVLANNEALMEAVRDIIISKFEITDIQDGIIDDLRLGQMTRARLVGIKKINEAFKEINQYKTIVDNPARINQAR